jgi:DNA replication and repair protein RecF
LAKMRLNYLQLINFKNYKNCSFNFSPKFNFLYGNNGNGKTNVLEAISMLCFTKSFLQSPEHDCVKYDEDMFKVRGDFENTYGLLDRVIFKYNKVEEKKRIELNDEPIGSISAFFGKIPLVVLSPGDIKLTAGTPADRRRNFDILISQISRIYFDDLRNLNHIIRQKNSLLKENYMYKRYSQGELRKLIELWNEEMIPYGVRIVLKRKEFVSGFSKYMKMHFENMVGNAYTPFLEYQSELLGEQDISDFNERELKSNFEKVLEGKFLLEVKRGITLAGPQRDNYVLQMKKDGNLFDVRAFASQGEHKTFIIALKLSEYMYLKDKLESVSSGEPILLLDDLFSELDKHRTDNVSKVLPNFNQVFLTTTDIGYLKYIKKYSKSSDISVFNIVNGTAETTN